MNPKMDLGSAVRDALPQYKAPASLREWAREQANAADPVGDAALKASPQGRASSPSRLFLYAYAASLGFVGFLGWTANGSYHARQESAAASNALVAELVDTHVRSLIGDHLIDVKSTDQHTVKPWFAGKTDFAPRVPDLTSAGFPLLGGRIDYVRGHTTATLVYGRRRHTVNVFIWPEATGDAQPAATRYKGYSLLHWDAGGLSYWAVTDAAPADLEELRKAFDSAV